MLSVAIARLLALEDISAGSVTQWLQAAAAKLGRWVPSGPAAVPQPFDVVVPPGAVGTPRRLHELGRVLRILLGHLVVRLGVAWRVDDRGDVAAGRQHQPGNSAPQVKRAIA